MEDVHVKGDGYTIVGGRHPHNWANHPGSSERFKSVTVEFTDGPLLEIVSGTLIEMLPHPNPAREFIEELAEFHVHNPLIPARGHTVSSLDHDGAFGVVADGPTEEREGKLFIPVCFAPGQGPVMVEMDRLAPAILAS